MLGALGSAASAPVADEPPQSPSMARSAGRSTKPKRIFVVDHQDSFVHTLVGYVKELGAHVVTMRPELARETLASGQRPDLVLLSPGPGTPEDFDLSATI